MKKALIITGAMVLSTTVVMGIRFGARKMARRKQVVEES